MFSLYNEIIKTHFSRGGSRAAAASKMERFVILVDDSAVSYYHKALHLGCCSSPRSAFAFRKHILLQEDYFNNMNSISSNDVDLVCLSCNNYYTLYRGIEHFFEISDTFKLS